MKSTYSAANSSRANVSKANATQFNFGGAGGIAAAAAAGGPLDPAELDVAAIGWQNVELKYAELKAMLSAPTTGLNAREARVQQKQAVSLAIVTLLESAQRECRKLLMEGQAKAAAEGGLKALKLKEDYYGPGSLQLVAVYFHLARTNQFMDKFKAAEEFLSLAQWIILREPDADVSLKAELHQSFGLLYASDAKLDAALKQLTCATYYLCVMNGPEHVLTSFGYFDLGNVFAARSHMENAMAFYDKVKEIWSRHLMAVLDERLEGVEESTIPFSTPLLLGEENMQDAVKMLRGIVGLQTERFTKVHPSVCKAEFVLGLLFLFNYDSVSANSYLLRALEISRRVYGPMHHQTVEISNLMTAFELDVPEDTAFAIATENQNDTSNVQNGAPDEDHHQAL